MNAFTHTKIICAPTAWSCPAGEKSPFNKTAAHSAEVEASWFLHRAFSRRSFKDRKLQITSPKQFYLPNGDTWHQKKQVPVGHYKGLPKAGISSFFWATASENFSFQNKLWLHLKDISWRKPRNNK